VLSSVWPVGTGGSTSPLPLLAIVFCSHQAHWRLTLMLSNENDAEDIMDRVRARLKEQSQNSDDLDPRAVEETIALARKAFSLSVENKEDMIDACTLFADAIFDSTEADFSMKSLLSSVKLCTFVVENTKIGVRNVADV
jgi:hypothetical protein